MTILDIKKGDQFCDLTDIREVVDLVGTNTVVARVVRRATVEEISLYQFKRLQDYERPRKHKT